MKTKQKSGRSMWGIIITFCLGLWACGGDLIPGQEMSGIKDEPVYFGAMALAKSNSEVINALGEPIADSVPSYKETSAYEIENGQGFANFDIVLTGRYAVGVLRVEATLTDGIWSYQVMQVRLADGEMIYLLDQ